MITQQSIASAHPIDREELFADALKSRDPAAWRELFSEHYRRVYAYAYVRTGSAADAEDIAASVFVAAVDGIDRYRYRGAPIAAWLFRIAHNETVDALKRRTRERTVACDEGVNLNAVAAHDGMIDRAVTLRDLSDALARLKPEHRNVLVLRLIEGRGVEEVARMLGRSEGAIKMSQLRALKSLRELLGR